MINKIDTAKIIGIGEDGVTTLDKISHKVKNTMDIEKIFPNQDVDKDYVRELLDGIEVLYLVYNSEDKSSLQIVNAIGYMSDERRVLSIGIDTATKENKDSVNVNREFKLNCENEDELINLFNMMLDAISEECTISVDITDLKEILACDKGIKYTYKTFTLDNSKEEVVSGLVDTLVSIGEEFDSKKELIMIQASEKISLSEINEIIELLQEKIEDSYDALFSLHIKEDMQDNVNIGLILN